MAKILISYGSGKFVNSAYRLKHMAKKIGYFDKIVIYSVDDLPKHIINLPLFHYDKGGGYWVWKPYIINDMLRKAKIGDIIVYMDAGCRINPNVNDWAQFDQILKTKDYIFFQYRDDYDYNWDIFGTNSPKIKHWTKPSTRQYFIDYFKDESFLDANTLVAGFCIFKKKEHNVISDEWLSISMFYPDLIMDPFGKELSELPPDFNVHRHDQSLLSSLVHHYRDSENVCILPEKAESQWNNASVIAERYTTGNMSFLDTIKFKLYYLLK